MSEVRQEVRQELRGDSGSSIGLASRLHWIAKKPAPGDLYVRMRSELLMNSKKKTMMFIIGICFLLVCNTHAVDTNKVSCVTDKEIYQQGEDVAVTITNNASDEITIVDRKYIDGGFATIEIKDKDGTWHAIELYAAANIASSRILRKGESHGYIWKTIGYHRMDTVAVSGAYRIIFHNGIISNQFFIRDRTLSH